MNGAPSPLSQLMWEDVEPPHRASVAGYRRREQKAGPAWRAPLLFTGFRAQDARREGVPPRRSGYGDGTKLSSLWVFFFGMFMPIGTAC